MEEMEEQVFLDGVCPHCGWRCGNGGQGMTLRCPCGWTGGLTQEDLEALRAFIHRHQEKNRDDTCG